MTKTIFVAALPVFGLVAACSSSSTPNAGFSCDVSGGPVTGTPDTHCGTTVQPVSEASCFVDASAPDDASMTMDAGDDGGSDNGGFGATLLNDEGDDDDCKYHVKWSATPICTGGDVFFTVAITIKATSQPLTRAPVTPEVFLSDTHPAPSTHPASAETSTKGTYTVGPVRFDKPGQWTVRFHFNEQCSDVLPDSPHGHAAFFVNVP
jgi:hypothetical protein